MPTATQLTVTQLDLTGAHCPALFCSGLQPSDAPTATRLGHLADSDARRHATWASIAGEAT